MVDRESASSSGTGPLTGFTGGLFKVATAPLQLPVAILTTTRQKNILYGVTFGTLKGMGMGVANVVGGTVQVVKNAIPANPMDLVTRKLAYLNGTVK